MKTEQPFRKSLTKTERYKRWIITMLIIALSMILIVNLMVWLINTPPTNIMDMTITTHGRLK